MLGSIYELGSWNKKNITHHLMWTKGNKWISRTPLETSCEHFRYKYVIMQNKGSTFVEYEKGIDKIADLDLIEPDSSDDILYLFDVW